MDTVNILLYLVILILFYVFYKLILTSRKLCKHSKGLLGVIDKKEFDTIKDHKDFLISSPLKVLKISAKLPIKDYCIASYNSAITGKSVNKDM